MSVHRTKTVLISGAGIAGPALAFWLRRYGFEPTVVERAGAPRPGGQAVDVRGAARDVVDRMGIMSEVRRLSLDERGFAYVEQSGRQVAWMPADHFGGEGIVAEIEINRGDLSRVLYEATRDEVEYLFDDSIHELVQDDAGVKVTFLRHAPRTFDLVIGADGVHSRVRALAFGDESSFVRPLGAYHAYFTLPHPVDTGGWFEMYSLPGRRMAAIRPGARTDSDRAGDPDRPHPHGSTAMFSFASAELDYDRRDVERQKQILAETFAGAGWRVPLLLDAMWHAPDFYFDAFCQVQMDRWATGRTALLGDAGYSPSPLTGLGTSLALVGAYVLAGELAAADGDHRVAFARYQDELRDYVRQCQRLPPGGIGGFLPAGRHKIWLRNRSMRLMTSRPLRRLVARVFATADSITLKRYP
ncbi:MAG TPA: FAD-dependent monooxygenase [Micromonosporaceae bacterium]